MAYERVYLDRINGKIFKIKKNKFIYSKYVNGDIMMDHSEIAYNDAGAKLLAKANEFEDRKIQFDELITKFNYKTGKVKCKIIKDNKTVLKFDFNCFTDYVELYLNIH